MICNENARNNGKLLAAIIAMLMVVCAVAVVAMPSSDAYTPVEGGNFASTEVTIDSADDLTGVAQNGVIVIDSATTITLNANIGSASEPVDVAFILNANLTIKSTEGQSYSLYIATTNDIVSNGDNLYSSVIYFGADSLTFAVEDAKVFLDNASQNFRTKAIFNSQYATSGGYNATVSVTDGDLTLSQTGTVATGGSGSAWLGATGDEKKSTISLNNANLVCNGTAAFQDTVITTTGDKNTITMNDVEVGLVADDGSDMKNLAYTVNGANVQGLAFKGTVNVAGTTFDINDANRNNNASRAGVMLYGGSAVTMDAESELSADTLKVAGSNWNGDLDATDDAGMTMPSITGGTVEGAFMPSTGTGEIPAANYTLSGVTFGDNAAVSEGAAITVKGTVTGTVQNDGTVYVSKESADQTNLNVSNLTVVGGTVDASNNKMPNLDGVTFNDGGINYITYTLTQNGFKVTLGVTPGVYGERDNYAGYKGAGVRIISITDPTGGDVTPQQSFITSMEAVVYANEEEANNPPADPSQLTPITEAGDNYVIKVTALLNIPETLNMNIEETFAYKVLPATVTNITIVGAGESGAIENQYYNPAGDPGLVAGTDLKTEGVDYIVQVTIGGKTITLDPSQYTQSIAYESGKYAVGSATLTVTLRNYAYDDGTNTAMKGYEIANSIDHLEIVPDDKKFYVGMEISTGDFTVTGVYTDGSKKVIDTDIEILVGDSTQAQKYYDQAGPTTLNFKVKQGDAYVPGTATIEVIGIDSISVENVSTSDKYKIDYYVDESFVTSGMKVTINYANGDKAVLQDVTETGTPVAGFVQDTATQGFVAEKLSVDVKIDPSKLNIYGKGQTIYADYFGARAPITVNVTLAPNTYGIIYMDGDKQLAIQTGKATDVVFVYNYVWGTDSGFVGWEVENFGAVYLAGTAIEIGANEPMWGDDNVLYLHATFGDNTGDNDTPATASENILVSVVSTETGVNVYLVALDGGYIPAGTITVTYYYTIYNDILGAVPMQVPITFTMEEDSTLGIVSQTFDFPTDVIGQITNVDASFGDFESEMIVYANTSA